MMKDFSIFFDLDDTLYDRARPFIQAYQIFFAGKEELSIDQRKAYWACEKRGNEVYMPSQTGEITMEEMYIYRYQKGLADVGIEITEAEALAFEKLYRNFQKEIIPAEGVPELLDFCVEAFHKVGIITNGPEEKQAKKLQVLKLGDWIPEDLSLISGKLKIEKPDPEIFHIAERLAETAPEKMIYVGDSFEKDIKPAHALGWKTIYLNRKSAELDPEDICPDLVLEGDTVLRKEHLIQVCDRLL